jgi:hypothetical protein
MTHQVYACLSSLLFFFKVFLEPYFFDATVGFFDKRIHVPLILGALAG